MWLVPEGEFQRLLDRERSRADRNSHAFSLVALDTANASPSCVGRALGILKARRRLTDDIGWLGPLQIGVLLPDTGASGVVQYVGEVHGRLTKAGCDLPSTVYTYRGNSEDGPHWFGQDDSRRRDDRRRRDGDEPIEMPDASATPPVQDRSATSAARADVRDLTPFFLKPLPGWKRLLDLFTSAVALLLLSPVFLAIAIAVKATSRGPVIFRQPRAGKGGRPFMFFKFRTMYDGADAQKEALRDRNEVEGPVFKIRNDPRITPVGRVLRKSSLDELPQLWNVLKGDMSLVGPRPPTLDEVPKYETWQRRRLDLTGGITGFWQVSGRNEVKFTDWMRMDIQYSRERSPGTDFSILLRTVWAVLSGRGAA
jgi:lipopolysaccharide/colanic/teichoic acid biosynthesis glycosyltransferase